MSSSIFSATMPTLCVKQGATLQLIIAVKNDDGSAFDLTTVTVSATVRDINANQIDSLALSTNSTPGQLTVAQDTSTWPLGRLACDFKLADSATHVVLKSDTFAIVVEAAVTT